MLSQTETKMTNKIIVVKSNFTPRFTWEQINILCFLDIGIADFVCWLLSKNLNNFSVMM